MRVFASLLVGLMTILVGQHEEGDVKMEITSRAFSSGNLIPSVYTCDGQDISPPLGWTGPPKGTKSFALISDDPDAPAGTWVHWVIWNIPPATRSLEEDRPKTDTLPDGSMQGTNDFRRVGYGGPCPPSGTHRYFFKLFALDAMLHLSASATKKDLEQAMQGHILARSELMGRYRRG